MYYAATPKEDQILVFKTDYRLMQVKSIAECSKGHSAILSTFIKLLFVIKIFFLSIFEWPLIKSHEKTYLVRQVVRI